MGTATSTASRAWLTLDDGELTEVYAPDLSTPSLRDLQFVVTDGKSFAEREREDATHRIVLRDPRSLTYRQVNTARSGRWRITKTYVTDPRRSAVLVKVRLESLTGRPYKLYALLDPALSNTGDDDVGETRGHALVARDDKLASALVSKPAPTRDVERLPGQERRLDGPPRRLPDGLDLRARRGQGQRRPDRRAARDRAAGPPARHARARVRRLRGRGRRHRRARRSAAASRTPPAATPRAGTPTSAGSPRPRSAAGHRRLYDVSAMVLAGLEDKTYRGAGIASPSMAWVWGTLDGLRALPPRVVARPLPGGHRADRGRRPRGRGALARLPVDAPAGAPTDASRRTRGSTAGPYWTGLQLDEVADPILLASQLGRSDRGDLEPRRARRRLHPRAGPDLAGALGEHRRLATRPRRSPPRSPRWSAPPTSPSATARPPRPGTTARWRTSGRRKVAGWTRTTNGPLSSQPYYLRVTTDGNADAGTEYTIGDGGPTIDQRRVVDTSFLELVRLGVKPADDPDIRSTLPVVDRELGVTTPNGQFWHRYNFDGYGETRRRQPVPRRRQPGPAVAAARR